MQGPIYGIDPGTKETGWILWDGQKAVESGIDLNDHFLERLRAHGSQEMKPIPAYIEMIACYGMAVGRETFETCLWIGRFIEVLDILGWPWRLVYRTRVKIHHCHSAKAKDANVSQAIRDKYGDVGTKKAPGPLFGVKSHVWSALAIATYALESELPCINSVVDPETAAADAEKKAKKEAKKEAKKAKEAAKLADIDNDPE